MVDLGGGVGRRSRRKNGERLPGGISVENTPTSKVSESQAREGKNSYKNKK